MFMLLNFSTSTALRLSLYVLEERARWFVPAARIAYTRNNHTSSFLGASCPHGLLWSQDPRDLQHFT